MRSVGQVLMRFCAYTHLWQVLKFSFKERRLPESAKQGVFIALLGFFCPIFWFALLTGASKGELIFHACHSGLVFFIGLVLIVKALKAEKHVEIPNND